MTGIEPEANQFRFEPTGVRPQPFLEFRLVAHDPDRLATGLHHSRRVGGGEQERSRPLGQDLAQGDRSRHVPTQDPDGLAQRADLDGDAAMQPEVVDRAAAVPPEHTAGMGVVDHDGRAEVLGRSDHLGEWRDIAIHGEDPVRDDQDQPVLPAARPARLARFAQDLAQRGDVGMRVDLPGCLRQAHAIDDRGVIEGIGDDQVRLAGHGRDDPGVRAEARLERQDGGGILERRQFRFQRLVHRHRPGDRSDGTAPDAVVVDGSHGRCTQAWVVGESQVIVGREADHPALIDRDDGPLRR